MANYKITTFESAELKENHFHAIQNNKLYCYEFILLLLLKYLELSVSN